MCIRDSGMISGIPDSPFYLSVRIRASNDLGDITTDISLIAQIPLSNFSYPESSFFLVQGSFFQLDPSILGDDPTYRINSRCV